MKEKSWSPVKYFLKKKRNIYYNKMTYYCVKDIDRCPYKRQITTINETRERCLAFCMSQPEFKDDWKTDMYSSRCGKFCQNVVDQVVKEYGYSKCCKKIQPSIQWYQQPIQSDVPQIIRGCY